MKAMILAAGLGTRLRPLTEKTPKALILVHEQPLITYTLRLLKKYGFTDVLINLHHLGDLIRKELGHGKKWGLKIEYSYEPELLGTGGGLLKAKPFFGNDSLLVLNSDILIDVDLEALQKQHAVQKNLATLVVRPMKMETEKYTPLFFDTRKRLRGFGSNAISDLGSSDLENFHASPFSFTGVHMMESRLLDYLPEGKSCIIRQGYVPALKNGEKISGFFYQGYWNDLGTIDRLRQAERDLRPSTDSKSPPLF